MIPKYENKQAGNEMAGGNNTPTVNNISFIEFIDWTGLKYIMFADNI